MHQVSPGLASSGMPTTEAALSHGSEPGSPMERLTKAERISLAKFLATIVLVPVTFSAGAAAAIEKSGLGRELDNIGSPPAHIQHPGHNQANQK